MIDAHKQVIYWRDSSSEDWQVAIELVQNGRLRHGLYFAQLALEKLLKAHVCLATQDLAPRIHSLVRLAEIADLSLTPVQYDVLAEMNAFNIEGRYPDTAMVLPSAEEARSYMQRAQEVVEWLKSQLP
jgi:HEPN domain-containing protein